jgi:hypothetical protein
MRVAVRRGVKALGATIRTKPVVVALVRYVRGRIVGLDLHATHRVNRIAGAPT